MPNLRGDEDEYEPNSGYQDDLTIDDGSHDPAMDELTDDPTEGFGVPDDKYAEELEKLAVDVAPDPEHEDFREHLEDMNEDGNDASKAA